ncbi:MAG: [FeFe] hydrogenase H-cluster maturation GTPase HydF [Tenuifilaceae bacterium]
MAKGKESKPHVGIYGRRNSGKSSIINMLAGQSVAIVSEQAGTTTDPVKKSLELTGFGPIVLIDTAGMDDTGDLGKLRVDKTLETIKQVDLGIVVLSRNHMDEFERMLVESFRKHAVPFIVVHNKQDIEPMTSAFRAEVSKAFDSPTIVEVSATKSVGLERLAEAIKEAIPEQSMGIPTLLGDIVSPGDVVLLITPIDSGAPAGRLILPQVQTIRDILDNNAVSIVLKETEVASFLESTGIKLALAITDSQIFGKANALIPPEVPLTSFSILLARLKGDFENYLKGTPMIDSLKDGDRVLILESCTHHVSCDDIGRHKIPAWLAKYTGKKLEFEVVAGLDELPRSITDYALVVQCGGCVVTRKQLHNRLKPAIDAGIPVTNYGMTIAYTNGIFKRAVEPVLWRKI